MKIEFKLDNPKRCSGCPAYSIEENAMDGFFYENCGKKYFKPKEFHFTKKSIRPKKCIDENGE